MPGRTRNEDRSRYSFNNMEDEPEISSGHKDTKYRTLDTRSARWMSVDPAANLYYSWSSYNLSADNPLANSDPSGATIVPPSWYGQRKEYDGSGGYIGTFVWNLAVGFQNSTFGTIDYAHDTWNTAAQGKNPISKVSKDLGKTSDKLGIYLKTTPVSQIASDLATMETVENVTLMYLMSKPTKAKPLKPTPNPKTAASAARNEASLQRISLEDRPYVISAVIDDATGTAYIGHNKTIKSIDDVHPELKKRLPEESLKDWTTYNCAECDAFNKALKAGAKWEDLNDMHTLKFDHKTKDYIPFERCDNCKVTYKDKNPTSEGQATNKTDGN